MLVRPRYASWEALDEYLSYFDSSIFGGEHQRGVPVRILTYLGIIMTGIEKKLLSYIRAVLAYMDGDI